MALESAAVSPGRAGPAGPRPYPTTEGAVLRTAYVWSSVGSKVVLAVTGIALALFLPIHLAGNLLLLVGAEEFNRYAQILHSIPILVPIVEIGLLALFVIHSSRAMTNYFVNRKARGGRYAVKRWAGGVSRKTWASTTMVISGLTIGIFVPTHILQMKYGAYYPILIDGEPGRDLFRLVRELFKSPGIVAFYMFSTSVVGAHIYHGFASAFQSLGLYNRRLAPAILLFGRGFGAVLGLGFFALPVYLYFAP
jgi:succinate dehydrogenase / fumarate reductase cytochrome b subunit